MKRETVVGRAEDCDEVVLPGTDGAFGSITAVLIGWHELEVDAFGSKVLLEGGGTFIVKIKQSRRESGGLENLDEVAVALEDGGTGARRKGFCEDVIAVIVIEDKDIFVTPAGGNDEFPGQVGVSLTADIEATDIHIGGARIRRSGRREEVVGGFLGRGASGLNVLAFGVLVTFDCWDTERRVGA